MAEKITERIEYVKEILKLIKGSFDDYDNSIIEYQELQQIIKIFLPVLKELEDYYQKNY